MAAWQRARPPGHPVTDSLGRGYLQDNGRLIHRYAANDFVDAVREFAESVFRV